MPFDTIRDEDQEILERKFEKEEILQALHSSQGDKSPGLDGFTMGFFQNCWRVVESDVLAVFEEFHE